MISLFKDVWYLFLKYLTKILQIAVTYFHRLKFTEAKSYKDFNLQFVILKREKRAAVLIQVIKMDEKN